AEKHHLGPFVPLRVVEEGHVVDRHDLGGNLRPHRHRVVRAVVDVDAQVLEDAGQLHLLPDQAKGAGGRRLVEDGDTGAGRLPPLGVVPAGKDREVHVGGPAHPGDQLEHVPAGAGRVIRDGRGVQRQPQVSVAHGRASPPPVRAPRDSHSSRWRAPAAAQVRAAARARPAATRSARRASSVATSTRAVAMASTSVGSTSWAAPPALGTGLATTGAPQAMASTTGRPNPSTRGTETKTRAPAYRPASTAGPT